MIADYGMVNDLDDVVDVAFCGNTPPKLVLRRSGRCVAPCIHNCIDFETSIVWHVVLMVGTAMTAGTRTGT